MTPITEIPSLIENFVAHLATTPALQQFATKIKPLQVALLFDRLRLSAERQILTSDGELRRLPEPPILDQAQVIDTAVLLLNALNRAEIFNTASVLFSNGELIGIIDRIPSPTLDGVPEIVVKAVQDMIRSLPSHKIAAEIVDPIRNRYPVMFPHNLLVAERLLAIEEVVDAMSRDLIGSVMALVGVGIRFEMHQFLKAFPGSFDVTSRY